MWEQAIETYNKQTTESRIGIVFPDLRRRLEQQQPRRLLDYGCGPGLFLRDFSSKLHIEQVGFDTASGMIDEATSNCNQVAQTTITNTLEYPDGHFDAITLVAVWMCWETEEDCLSNLKEIRRLLSPAGKLYAVVTHPAFHDLAFSTFRLLLDNCNYLNEGTPYTVEIFDQGHVVSFTDYHWPLSAMSRQMKAAGFKLDEIIEYPDVRAGKGCPWMLVSAT